MKANIINRTALTVIPKQPYIDWANSLDDGPKFDVNAPYYEPTVYLVDEVVDDAALTRTLRRHFVWIFEHELAGWHRIEEDWPQKRDFRTFKNWFTVKVSTIVLDLGKYSIQREEFQAW